MGSDSKDSATPNDMFEAVARLDSPLMPGRTLGELGQVRSVDKTINGKIKVDLHLHNLNNGIDEAQKDKL